MKKILIASIVFIAFTLTSCKWYAIHRYQMNKPFSFKQKTEFINYLKKKKAFKLGQVLYLENESYAKFIHEKLTQDSTSFYVGTYFNDSMMVKRSLHLNENSSCIGRIELEIKNNISRKNSDLMDFKKASKLSAYSLKYLSNDQVFDINADKKPNKIFLTFTTRYGKWYDKLYKEINELQQQNQQNANVYIIVLDPIYKLQ